MSNIEGKYKVEFNYLEYTYIFRSTFDHVLAFFASTDVARVGYSYNDYSDMLNYFFKIVSNTPVQIYPIVTISMIKSRLMSNHNP